MAALTMRDLDPLFEQYTGEGQVLSCYAGLRASEGFRPDWRSPFEAQVEALRKLIGADGRARKEFEENQAIVRRTLEDPATQESCWFAVFASARRDFTASFSLDVPVETDLVQHPSPYLVPLLAAIHRRREYLAIHTDTHRGRIYAATPAGVRLLVAIDEAVPKKQHSAGQTWGLEQATIARHREDRILHYRKGLVDRVEMEWGGGSYTDLLLLGDHETLAHLREALPPRLAAVVRREKAEPWYERVTQVEEAIRTMAFEVLRQDEEAVAEGFWDLLAEGRSLAAGPQAVLDAVQNGLVGPEGYGYLVFGPDPRETIGRCQVCRFLSYDVTGTCPKCGGHCREGNLWEELLLTALRHGLLARFVSDPQRLSAQDGVVAVLPRDRPGLTTGKQS